MDHPDLAQIACIVAAAGAVLLLAGRGRVLVVGGLALIGLGGAGLIGSASDIGRLDTLTSASGAAAGALGLLALAAAAAAFVRRPAWVPVAVLVAAPLRPPVTIGDGGGFPIQLAEDGELGRLLLLYFVLAAAALALAWRALSGREQGTLPGRALPPAVAIPAAVLLAFACCSLLWADDLRPGVDTLVFFLLPFAVLLGVVGRSPFPDWMPRTLATVAIAMASLFAVIGLFQAATRELFFFAPNLQLSNANSSFFRVTSLFGDPSLYGRHLVVGLGVVLALMALRRIDVRLATGLVVLLWAGLFVSYSQSSMVALVVVTLMIAALTGTRRVRLAVLGTFALVAVIAIGYLASIPIRGESLRTETADRSQRIEETVRVIEADPVTGVGVGGQPQASRRLSDRDRPTPNFVSHTAPLTVFAELGAIGLALLAWLLVGATRMLLAARRLEPALGLVLLAALLGVFVQSLFYPGFLEDPLTWVVLGIGAGYLTWPRRDDGTGRGEPAPETTGAAA
ncbi:MAG TPA: O-antigen ligase family protein [Thermoleophilaceae bacterium]|nr:O-antigen ligase family protein [Thermoleophilaceae bacterium]